MQVIFYSGVSKRINSTKRPNGGIAKDIQIKQECDFHNPVLHIQASPGQYNYFQIGDVYYYVSRETIFPNQYLQIEGTVDSMATCADEIKATTAFVLRSGVGSTDIIDSFAPPLTRGQIAYESESVLFPLSSTGTYLVSLSNMPAPVSMTLGQMLSLYNALNSKDATQQVENNFSDLSGIVKGAVWIPYEVPTLGSLAIKAGDFDTGVSASYISTEITTKAVSFTLPIDATVLGSSAYSSLKLYLPHCGVANLSVDDFRTSGTVSVLGEMDNYTGNITYYISDGSYISPVASFSGSCGIPISIGSTSYSFAGGLSGLVSGIAYKLANDSNAAFFQASHSASQCGGGANRTSIASVCCGLIKRQAPEALSAKSGVIGLPTFRTMSLGSVNGYVECHNASIISKQEPEVVAECNSYLNSGAYIE